MVDDTVDAGGMTLVYRPLLAGALPWKAPSRCHQIKGRTGYVSTRLYSSVRRAWTGHRGWRLVRPVTA